MKKGQQTGSQAAIVIGIMTLLIIFYIMFLPQDVRDELLGPTSGGSGTYNPGGSGTVVNPLYQTGVIFSKNVGKLTSQDVNGYEYDLSTTHIYYSENMQVIARVGNVYIKNSWFDKVDREFTFNIKDKTVIDDVSFSVTLGTFRGSLIIDLNGKELYNYPVKSSNLEPIPISVSELNDGENRIRFQVSDVGVSFWTANEIEIEDAKIIAKISDLSRSESQNLFYIEPSQAENVETVTISYSPDCKTADIGILNVLLNGKQIFKGVPDCGILNRQRVDPEMLSIGKNSLYFSTDRGSYLIDQISVKTSLKDAVEPTYYFELDEDMFTSQKKSDDRCGDNDGVCPEDCDEDVDKDCCFQKYVGGYWCDVRTDYLDDRCVGFVDEGRCENCPSGYEKKSGSAPDACEDLCGDDKDGDCPVNCNPDYDKDCCFDRSGDQFWCEDLPISGEDFVCADEVTFDSCKSCTTGYDGEDTNPKCVYDNDEDTEEALKSSLDVLMRFEFTEAGLQKEAELYINGQKTGFDTREEYYEKNIDSFVESGTNSIRIIPKSDLEIRKLTVKVEE